MSLRRLFRPLIVTLVIILAIVGLSDRIIAYQIPLPLTTPTLVAQAAAPPPGGTPPSPPPRTPDTRGDCPNLQLLPLPPLTGLLPPTGVDTKWRGGATLAERPTFWLYFPYQFVPGLTNPTENKIAMRSKVQFVLKEANSDTNLYEPEFQVSGSTPGIVGFKLPADAPPLQVGKDYIWRLKVYCRPNSDNPAQFAGWVRRVNNSALANQSGRWTVQRIDRYLGAGLWYDALHQLIQLRPKEPRKWERVLKDNALGEFSEVGVKTLQLSRVQ